MKKGPLFTSTKLLKLCVRIGRAQRELDIVRGTLLDISSKFNQLLGLLPPRPSKSIKEINFVSAYPHFPPSHPIICNSSYGKSARKIKVTALGHRASNPLRREFKNQDQR